MAEDDVEKSEEPTPKRRAEALREGQVTTSKEAFIFANLLGVTLALLMTGPRILDSGVRTFQRLWIPRTDLSTLEAVDMLRTAFGTAASVLTPILLAGVASILAIGVLQTKGNVATKALKPKFSTLNPQKNFSRIFKKQAPIELPKSLLKIGVVAGMIWFVVGRHVHEYFSLSQLPLTNIVGFQMSMVLSAFFAGCVALLLIAMIDFSYQRWQTEKGLKMSKSEVKDERRQSEGDPLIRSHRLSRQFEAARMRMMEAVPDADVVVTNPEHISVALLYERADMPAPKIVAKGAGFLALRIREIAEASGVPIVENRPLARSLYRSVKVGQWIPEALFQAVAEVLAFVHRLRPAKERSW